MEPFELFIANVKSRYRSLAVYDVLPKAMLTQESFKRWLHQRSEDQAGWQGEDLIDIAARAFAVWEAAYWAARERDTSRWRELWRPY